MPAGPEPEPEYFRDLNLDQIVRAVTRKHAGFGLETFFHLPLRDPQLIGFRQAVFRDLEDPALFQAAERFTAGMARTRRRLEVMERTKHPPQAHHWFLEAVLEYEATVIGLAEGLEPATAPGLRGLRDDLSQHVAAASFTGAGEQARRLRDRLGEVRYDLFLRGDKITVAAHDPGARFDFADQVLAAFARFRPDRPSGGRGNPATAQRAAGMNLDQVEAGVLDLVVELHPGVFGELAAFCETHRDLLDEGIVGIDRELRFYLGYLEFLTPLREAGLPFCHPEVSAAEKGMLAREVFDLALADKLVAGGGRVVVNDVDLGEGERILLVSGPNQGGKTTLSRAFGQLHHLAALGCPVPARRARLFLPDRILTHYERAENPAGLAGKLEEELLRLRAILDRATPDSLIVLNEIFTSTTSEDALSLSGAVLAALSGLDAQCLWVSFLDELSRLDPKTVSMVSTVTDDGAHTRTYKIERRVPDGRAYAMAMAERHGLTYDRLASRLGR
ncbi:DNA mismatch repair protein MutS [Actinomadura viridis]|uniref:DNA mismatch repair proteins mutS family domain-containing protein n=1 Tax=Actinomadura viridis TaxID=58110 RepID=A0A931GJD0_9ACTN|nr:hypothetical protein [Actinomadura viridis]MBG6089583.1 hypothetical protein [Actinomadura viridis]